jgi:hypothetical protein
MSDAYGSGPYGEIREGSNPSPSNFSQEEYISISWLSGPKHQLSKLNFEGSNPSEILSYLI